MPVAAPPGSTAYRRILSAARCALAGLVLGAAAHAEESWLRVDAPAATGTTVAIPLVEVRGRAAPYGGAAHDLVIALDVSDSTVLPSGWDVDGDGARGRTQPELAARFAEHELLAARMREADLDDSVLAAELRAARALLDRLDLKRDRVGLVAFSDRAELLAPLGSGRDRLEAALDALQADSGRWLRGTNLGDAVAAAQLALAPDAAASGGRQRSILLLSDGKPTLPPHGDMPRQHALWAANAAAAAEIRIYAFALGVPDRPAAGAPELGVFAEMAARTGGRFETLVRAGDAITRLRRTDLAGLAGVRIANATTGRPARALRVFPDGSFDGVVELAPGRNRLRVEAAASDGASAEAEREVMLVPAAAESQAQASELLRELRRRTEETQAWTEMERERRTRSLEIELRVERPDE